MATQFSTGGRPGRAKSGPVAPPTAEAGTAQSPSYGRPAGQGNPGGSSSAADGAAQAASRGRPAGQGSPGGSSSAADGAAQAPSRGRPRSEKAHQAILAAAAELLLDRGLSAVSMDAVAERAGVSKATIYRWWPTKETLALDALYTEWATVQPDPRDTGSLQGDLLALLRPWARLVRSRPYARVIAALLTEVHTDPAFGAEYRKRVVEPRRDQARTIFRRAIERGEIPASTDIEVAVDLVYGPLWHRLLHGHAPLNDRFVRDVVTTALNGLQPASAHAAAPAGQPAQRPDGR